VRILVDYRPALRERSGVGEYIHRLTEALVRVSAGRDEIALFSSSWKDRLVPQAIAGTTGVDRRVPGRVLTRLWHQQEWPPVDWLAGRYDVVHSSRPTLVPARRAAQVVTVHDLDFVDHPERTQAEFRGDYGTLARRHAQRADQVIAISAYTAGEVEARFDVPRSRITVCRPGRPAWTPRPHAPLEPYILFVGTLEPRKNIGGLLEAYARLLAATPDAPRLVLAGRALEESRDWLTRLESAPFAGKAEYLGYVREDSREGLYKGAALLVLPSFEEGFGLPALEALTVGLPVVASNRGALPEVIGDAGLLVDPTDTEGLAVAMGRIVSQPGLASELGARGVRRARLFDWNTSAEALRAAYDVAIAVRRNRQGREQ
jgi:glycosyltransferase involved in cell wall biosynthesis